MKIFRNILIILTALSGLITYSIVYISSHMQGLIKCQMPTGAERTKELLEQKRFWAQLGESYLMFDIFLILAFLLLTTMLIMWIRNKKQQKLHTEISN